MNGRRHILKLLSGAAFMPAVARAQGFAGLGSDAHGFAPVVPGRVMQFPADHGSHPEFRVEWWYVTANLEDAKGNRFGIQWTLFRQGLARGGADKKGFSDPTVWMAHAALSRADGHEFAERFARGSVGDAGVVADPFAAWIDDWSFKSEAGAKPLERAVLSAKSRHFGFALSLAAYGPLVLHGEKGFSRKSNGSEASYYYSQPFFRAGGRLDIAGVGVEVTGHAWLDREWSSQPLSSEQTGWDWFSLHLSEGRKLMLFQLRQRTGGSFRSGTLILPSGETATLGSDDITFEPKRIVEIAERRIPVAWHIGVRSLGLDVHIEPLTERAWMGTSIAYWEGPVSIAGSDRGVGYLEMTGY